MVQLDQVDEGLKMKTDDREEETMTKEQRKKRKKKEDKKRRKKQKKIEMAEKTNEKEKEKEEVTSTEEESQQEKKKKKKKDKQNDQKRKQQQEDDIEEEGEPKKKRKKKKEEEEEDDKEKSGEEDQEKAKKKKKKKKKKENEENSEVAMNPDPDNDVFKKCFYDLSCNSLSSEETAKYLSCHSIKLLGQGHQALKPIVTFAETKFNAKTMSITEDFDKPTPIQAMCWPVIASGRDIIGIAETGSGKTLAFSVPALEHMQHRKKNPPQGVRTSPMMLVVAPTRELAMQSQVVIEQAGKKCNVRSACLYGGVSKFEQRKALQAGVEVIVATPGRLLDLMEEGLCDLSGVSYLVLDEADRMLDQGFERAIRSIISHTHPSRQTCLFSATWPESVRELAHEFLNNPIKVTIGSEDLAAGKKVTQIVEVVEERSRDSKLQKLLLKYHKNKNRILIFVLYKKEADRVLNTMIRNNWNCAAIHGDKSQESRILAVKDFKSGKVPILVATDVAARGLDIPDVEYVINYSFPLTIEDYVHRIGRTGRAGKSGIAHTFFHAGDKLRAGELVNVLKDSNQEVPKDMNQFDLNVKRKEHKLYGAFGPKTHLGPMKKATKIVFD